MSYTLKDPDKGKCLQCGCEIYGRPGKKFCSIGCKNAFHNNKASNIRKVRIRTISGLNKNYDVLNLLIKSDIRTIPIVRIREMGFDENLITGSRHALCKHCEESCFDIVYYRTSAKIFNIRRIL